MRTIIISVLIFLCCGVAFSLETKLSGAIVYGGGKFTGSGSSPRSIVCPICERGLNVFGNATPGPWDSYGDAVANIRFWGESESGKTYPASNITYNGYYSVTFDVSIPDEDIPHDESKHDDKCTCGKPCRHCCTCGKNTDPCGGTAADCACHGCTCGKCCSHTCTCGKAPPCGGKPGDCECHDNKCTCGACCSDKCDCGKWSGPECHGTAKDCDCHDGDCWACCDCRCECTKRHLGPCTGTHESECEGDSCKCKTSNYTHCSCHAGGDHGDCCEHHKKDFIGKEHQKLNLPGKLDDIDFTPPTPGKPSYGNPGQGIGLPNALPPDYEPLQFPEQKEIKKEPLTWFKRSEEDFGFPEFKHEEAFDKIKEELGKKLNFDWVDKLKNAQSGGGADLSWTIQVQMYGAKVGPYKVDLLKYLNEFSSWQITQILRFLLVFVIGVVTFLGLARLLLRASEA